MIRTKFHSVVEIVANCGDVSKLEGRDPAQVDTLLLTEIPDPVKPSLRIAKYRLAGDLVADQGVVEIENAISKAPTMILTPSELKAALEEAL